MEVKGTVYKILEPQTGNSNGREWKKSSFVIEVPGNYPKKICFDVWGDNMENFNLQEGEEVMVGFDAESREYNGKWFTNLKAWKVDKNSNATATPNNTNTMANEMPDFSNNDTPMPSATDEPQAKTADKVIEDDDLPF